MIGLKQKNCPDSPDPVHMYDIFVFSYDPFPLVHLDLQVDVFSFPPGNRVSIQVLPLTM